MSILFRMSKTNSEPLLTEDVNRYVMFPIKDQDIWEMYKNKWIVFGERKKLIYPKI